METVSVRFSIRKSGLDAICSKLVPLTVKAHRYGALRNTGNTLPCHESLVAQYSRPVFIAWHSCCYQLLSVTLLGGLGCAVRNAVIPSISV
ncbi:MAG: hypothetical protein ACYCZA_00545 [Thiobacillus sp.]